MFYLKLLLLVFDFGLMGLFLGFTLCTVAIGLHVVLGLGIVDPLSAMTFPSHEPSMGKILWQKKRQISNIILFWVFLFFFSSAQLTLRFLVFKRKEN